MRPSRQPIHDEAQRSLLPGSGEPRLHRPPRPETVSSSIAEVRLRMNIEEVARKAKVSVATVSRTINGLSTVRPRTAERVRLAIEELGFHPDINARALQSGRSRIYGLIISDITNPFFPELVKAFEDLAIAHQLDVLIGNTDYNPERMKTCVNRMLQRKVDGVAIMASEMDQNLLDDFSSRGIPLVVMDLGKVGPKVSNIGVDYQVGMSEAVCHLVELGHQEIGFITGPLKLASAGIRYRSFLAARKHYKLKSDLRCIAKSDYSISGGYKALHQLVAACPQMSAVICSNDLSAIGVMQAAYEAGLRIPTDISVIGFDDIQLSAFAHPGLTTVRVPRRELASTAFMSLLRLGTSGETSLMGEQHTIHTRLVCRHSTAAPATRSRHQKS